MRKFALFLAFIFVMSMAALTGLGFQQSEADSEKPVSGVPRRAGTAIPISVFFRHPISTRDASFG